MKYDIEKIKKIPLYKNMLSHSYNKTILEIKNAGYFFDNYSLSELSFLNKKNKKSDYKFLDFLNQVYTENKVLNKENIILMTMGCFAPFHEGHDFMINSAIKSVSKDYNVIGVVIFPANDSYVKSKTKNQKYLGLTRLKQIKDKIYPYYDNIYIDDSFILNYKSEVNFPFLIKKLENQIKISRFPIPKIGIIFGDDNLFFNKALSEKKYVEIITQRTLNLNYLNRYKKDKKAYIIENLNYKKVSSTKVRKQTKFVSLEKKNEIYFIRNDIDFCLENKDSYKKEDFIFDFYNLIKEKIGHPVVIFNSKEEKKIIYNKYGNLENTISLDGFIDCKFNLKISRIFNSFNHHKPIDLYVGNINDLSHFIKSSIKNKIFDFIIIDDDRSSGFTQNFITNIFVNISNKYEKNMTIRFISSLYEYQKFIGLIVAEKEIVANPGRFLITYYMENNIYDIIDIRDFVFNSKFGGLTIKKKTSLFRIPYIYPHIDINMRASIDPDDMISFSKEIISLKKGLLFRL
jgi:nicotinic acid mononucleotide adenylyltransferase